MCVKAHRHCTCLVKIVSVQNDAPIVGHQQCYGSVAVGIKCGLCFHSTWVCNNNKKVYLKTKCEKTKCEREYKYVKSIQEELAMKMTEQFVFKSK